MPVYILIHILSRGMLYNIWIIGNSSCIVLLYSDPFFDPTSVFKSTIYHIDEMKDNACLYTQFLA